jgi:L-threonylcarbamoyladenylate synthase
MKTSKVNKYRVTKRALAEAVEVLRAGGVVVHPSESSYGLAVDPTNRAAIKKLFALKNRPSGKAVLLAAASRAQAKKTVQLSGKLDKLAQKYWPGPLTIVAPAKQKLDLTGTNRPTKQIAVRVPAAAWLRALAEGLGHPVTSTSVNLSGEAPLYSAASVRKLFADLSLKPDLILDVGRLPNRPPSTLVTEQNGKLKILRQGSVKI